MKLSRLIQIILILPAVATGLLLISNYMGYPYYTLELAIGIGLIVLAFILSIKPSLGSILTIITSAIISLYEPLYIVTLILGLSLFLSLRWDNRLKEITIRPGRVTPRPQSYKQNQYQPQNNQENKEQYQRPTKSILSPDDILGVWQHRDGHIFETYRTRGQYEYASRLTQHGKTIYFRSDMNWRINEVAFEFNFNGQIGDKNYYIGRYMRRNPVTGEASPEISITLRDSNTRVVHTGFFVGDLLERRIG